MLFINNLLPGIITGTSITISIRVSIDIYYVRKFHKKIEQTKFNLEQLHQVMWEIASAKSFDVLIPWKPIPYLARYKRLCEIIGKKNG